MALAVDPIKEALRFFVFHFAIGMGYANSKSKKTQVQLVHFDCL